MRAWAALASSVLYALATAWAATQVPPDGMPLHFDADGTANRLRSRSEAMTTSAVLGVVMLGLGVGLVLLARYGPLRAMNIPTSPAGPPSTESLRFAGCAPPIWH